ncbi:MAG: peptidase M61 [Thermoflexibacteraceae bacterium]
MQYTTRIFSLICLCVLCYTNDLYAQKKKVTQPNKPTTAVAVPPAAVVEIPKVLNSHYQYFIDLNKVKEDLLTVELLVPQAQLKDKEEVLFYIPKIVPGTYSIYDFGRFVKNFQAQDEKGGSLSALKIDDNTWRIIGAKKLYKITYQVEDTYDSPQTNVVFEPAGTNIEEGKNFILNTHGFFGYFQDLKRLSYEINIAKPEGFYGATSLKTTFSDAKTDQYKINNFMELVDAPMMYSKPDTTVMNVGGAEILVAVYSPTGLVESKFVAQNIKDILVAQKDYLGGKLPIEKYAFIIYLFKGMSASGAYGALEHSYSSLYFLPEMNPSNIAQTIRDIAAHEFFHIVTPLSIHSEEIHDFDFIQPKMSKHLWLYEGVVEYFAGHVQAKQGLMGIENYLASMRGKIMNAESFKKIPFTELSSKCLDTYKDQYGNVYEKGALIGLCLDLKIRQLSQGQKGLQELMFALSKEYGKEKAFKDEELFDKIAALTYPELREFFKEYVEGNKPLPLPELLAQVGITYISRRTSSEMSLGSISLGITPAGRIEVADISEMDEMGEEFGYQTGDVILELNKQKITQDNLKDAVANYKKTAKVGDDVKIVVERNGKKVKLKAKARMKTEDEFHILQLNPDASPQQLALRKAWIN